MAVIAENKEKNVETMVSEIKEAIDKDVKEVKEQVAGVTEIKADVDKIKTAVDRLETQLKSSGIKFIEKKYEPGQRLARAWKCQIIADNPRIFKGETTGKTPLEIAEKVYGHDENFVAEFKALQAGGNAGILINEAYFGEILPLLYNKLAVMQLGARVLPMPTGNLNIRRVATGSTASYIGEGKTANASKPTFGNMKLSAKKLLVKVPFSNDLLRSASPNADIFVRDDMIQQARILMDYTALYGSGTEYTPKGIKNATGVTDKSANELLTGDNLYIYMVKTLKAANSPMNSLGWVMPPSVFAVLYNETFSTGGYKYRDELKSGKFHGFPLVETNQISTASDAHAKADVFFGDFSQFFIGEQIDMEVRMSEEASYTDENGSVRSAFDYDETVVKAMMVHDMGVAYGASFVWGKFYTVA